MPRFPNESADYRAARDQLLAAERALREQAEKVAAMRRAMPAGGAVTTDYIFDEVDARGTEGKVALSELFAPGKESLFLYGFMYGPDGGKPCPMCTAFLDGLDGNIPHLEQRINVAVVARAPIQEMHNHADYRRWRNLRLLSSAGCSYQRDYLAEDADGNQQPMANVFVKRGDSIYHHWGSELLFEPWDGGGPRHVDPMWALWNVLDTTPGGRGDFFPRLSYD